MLNSVALMGRLVADPELKVTQSGISVVTIRLAVNRTYDHKQTDFIDVVAWRQQAEFIDKYFRKGELIVIEGAIQTRSYEDKNGNKRSAFEVVANQVHFGQSKKEGAGKQQRIQPMDEYEEMVASEDEDLPF